MMGKRQNFFGVNHGAARRPPAVRRAFAGARTGCLVVDQMTLRGNGALRDCHADEDRMKARFGGAIAESRPTINGSVHTETLGDELEVQKPPRYSPSLLQIRSLE
jgi:hypothetical protein